MGTAINFTVTSDGRSVKDFLRCECHVSSSLLTALKREEHGIERNRQRLRSIDILNAGDVVTITLPDDESDIPPVDIPIKILYEDAHTIVYDKPSFLTTHPVRGHQGDTLANAAAHYFQSKGEFCAFRAINRLDRDTSGTLLAAKNAYAAALLPKSVQKEYVGVCEGVLKEKITIDKPIRIKEGHTIERETGEGGQRAVTHAEPIVAGSGHTLVKFILETGRTHQIRVHMASIGHPLAGDDLYGGSREFISRQALHCAKISFTKVLSNEMMCVESPLPIEFIKLISRIL